MAIKQRGTPLDAILLEIIYPYIFRSGLRRQLQRWQIWHRTVPDGPAPAHPINLAIRISAQKVLQRRPSQTLSQKRAA